MIALALLVTGCGGPPSDRTAGGVTPDEARALDEAATMVEARRLPAEALRSPATPSAAPGASPGISGASPSAMGENKP